MYGRNRPDISRYRNPLMIPLRTGNRRAEFSNRLHIIALQQSMVVLNKINKISKLQHEESTFEAVKMTDNNLGSIMQ